MGISSDESHQRKKRYGDLDSAEIDELNLFIKKEFDLENDAIEGFIESGIELAFNIYILLFKVIRHKTDKNLPPQVD